MVAFILLSCPTGFERFSEARQAGWGSLVCILGMDFSISPRSALTLPKDERHFDVDDLSSCVEALEKASPRKTAKQRKAY
jgi:hypothetical protein